MPRSTISLESLSSPSPSPPPTEPALEAPRKPAIPVDQPTTGLDSDSELSELTDEEQDATEKRTTTTTAMPDREDDEGAGISGGSRSKSTSLRQGRPQRPSNRRGGRKKRSSIVPAPMWGWVENKAATIAQEEEEEDVADPPRAMEEEEDEEMRQEEEEECEGEEDDDEEDEDSERGPRRRMGPFMISRMPGIRRNHILPHLRRQPSSHDDDDDEGEDVADDPPAVNGTAAVDEEDDEEYGSGEDDPPYSARGVASRGRPPGRSAGQLRSARVALTSTEIANNTETGNDSEAEEDDDEDNATPKDDTKAAAEEDDDEEEVSDAEPVQAEDPESGNETVSEDEDGKESTVERPTTHISSSAASPSKLPKPVSPTTTTHSVDVTLPLPKDIVPIAVAAAASSIMAGSSVLEPASPSPTSSTSVSRASSRSPCVAPSAKPFECIDPDDDKETTSKSTKGKGKRKAPASDKTQDKAEAESHHSAAKTKAKDLPPLDLDIEMREGDQDDPDRSAGDIEVEEPSPDDDLEIESDLQPAHRAEALDVLATIELKFALLRERVYVEKMENLAWEEALVNDGGSHPELIHLQKELRKRRDKRLELASRKRTYEVANVTKRRRVDEEATWSWWKVARDELQTDMISETNRKRRRLERERRAVERPQPVRRIPNPPTETLPPPSLRKIVKNFPFNNRRHNKTDYLHPGPKQLIYPELSTLSSDDIANDLNFLSQNRRHPYESHRHPTVNMSVQMAPPLHSIDYNQHGGEIPGGFGGANRLPPPPQLVQYQHHGPSPGGNAPPHSSYSSYNGSSGRHHPPSNVQPNVHNHSQNHNPYPNDHEMGGIVNGPAHQGHQLLPHHPYFGSGSAGGPANVYPPISQHNGRRSISPVNLMPNGSGKQNGNWMGAGMGMGGFHSAPKSDWMDPRRNELDDEERALRERDKRERELRERDLRDRGHRERDHREREAHDMELERQRDQYHMQQHLHRQPPPSSGHPHLHQGPPPPPNPHHHHHRAHHHHVVHHHHGQSQSGHASSSLPPGGPILGSHDYDDGRPHSGHSHPTEVINISSSKSIPSHLKGDEHHPPSDYRDGRRQHARRPSGPEDRERPLATPFVMGSSHGSHPSGGHLNGTSSPRPTWNPSEDNSFRISSSSSAPAGYLSSHDGPAHSPGHRYTNSAGAHLGRGPPPVSSSSLQNSIGLSPPRSRPLPPPSPSASSSNYPNSSSHHSPRYGPPPSNRSPINLKMRPPSPLSSKLNAGPPSVYNPSPVALSGPGRTSTPTGHPASGSHILSDLKNGTAPPYTITSRTASPLTPFPPTLSHPNIATVLSGRPPTNGADRDRERERDRDRHISPRVGMLPPPPSKLSVPQLVDGH